MESKSGALRNKYFVILLIVSTCLLIGLVVAFTLRQRNFDNYAKANEYLEEGEYAKAAELFGELGNFKDSMRLKKDAEKSAKNERKASKIEIKMQEVYEEATQYYEQKEYKKAIDKLSEIDADEKIKELLKKSKYSLGTEYYKQENYEAAKKIFMELDSYEESKIFLAKINLKEVENSKKIIYEKACKLLLNKNYNEALEDFNEILDYEDSKEKVKICKKYLQEDERRLELAHTIVAGVEYVLAITNDNKVKSAGEDSFGECNGVKTWRDIVSLDCYGEVSIGLQSDGRVEVTGNLSSKKKKKISKWKKIIDVAAGEKYVVALKNNGKVLAIGHNGDGQCNVSKWRNVKDVDAGWRFTVGLTEGGELLFAGKVPSKMLTDYNKTKSEWKDVVKISASGGEPRDKKRGDGHVVGLKKDGTVIAIGDNSEGQCEVNEKKWTKKKIIDVAAGDWYTVGLTEDRRVLITGENNPGNLEHTLYIESEKLNSWKKIKRITAGYGMTVVMKSDNYLDIMGFKDGQNDGDAALEEITKWKNIKSK